MPWIAVIALLFLASSCGAQMAAGSGVVPWVYRSAPAYTVPPWPKPKPYPVTASWCRASALRITGRQSLGAAGTTVERFVFTNVSSHTCRIGGPYPEVTGELASGARAVLPIRHSRLGIFEEPQTADLPPGQHGYVDVGLSSDCPEYTSPLVRRLAFAVPSIGTVPSRYALPRTCHGYWMTRFGRFPRQPRPPKVVPGTADALTVGTTLSRRATHARPGSWIRFTVELHNPKSEPVLLQPCPSYTLEVYAPGFTWQHSLRLNCDTVTVIAPHATVRYAMRAPAPRRPGVAKLIWRLNTLRAPAAGAAVVVGV